MSPQGNTPKYGLIFHSSFIGRAGAKHKGRISRYLANKCSMASRIDSFSDVPENGGGISNIYGQKLKEQVEERLEFYKTGKAPKKNIDVMHDAMKLAGDDGEEEKPKKEKKAKKEKKDSKEKKEEEAPVDMETDEKSEKKAKKDKKRKAEEEPEEEVKKEKKEKKSKKAKKEESD